MENKTKEYLIFYFDILGYKDIILNNIIKEDEFIKVMEAVNGIVYVFRDDPIDNWITPEVYSFSDNFAICIEYFENDYNEQFSILLALVQQLQCIFLSEYGILIRGSIVFGKLYLNNNLIFGEGIIKAYILENESAIYPRILIHKDIIQKMISENDKKLQILKKDFDGKYFVDFLGYLNFKNFPCQNKEDIKKGYKITIEFNLKNNLYKLQVIKKLLWCCNYANNFFISNGEEKLFSKEELALKTSVDWNEILIKLQDSESDDKDKMIDIINNL